MIKLDKFKVTVPVAVFLVFTSCLHLCVCEDYSQQQNVQQQQQNYQTNNGYSAPSAPPFSQHHRNHHTRNNGGWGSPTESRTGIVVPLFLPMILFVGIVLLLFFAVVGSAAVAGSATAIGRHDIPTRFAFARDFSSSMGLARDVLSSEQCVERISCEMFRLAKGYKAQNWMLRAMELLPGQSNLTKRASRTLWRQKKISRNQRSGKQTNNCVEFQCSTVRSLVQAVKALQAD